MGWWWSSAGSPDAKSTLQPTESPSQPSPSPSPPASKPSPSLGLTSSRTGTNTSPSDEDDFHAAFPHLAPATTTSPPSEAAPTTTQDLATSTYPTQMSCTAAFDTAFYCSSFGGHFNDIYRYGELRSCSEHWADWRFCMRLKSHSRPAREELVRDHYRRKEEAVRGRPNSEDIWERRGEGESQLGAFRKDLEAGRG